MNSDTRKPTTKPTPTPKPTPTLPVEPQYGGVLRIANTYVLPPRMGVPGRINVGNPWLEPIVENFFGLTEPAEWSRT